MTESDSGNDEDPIEACSNCKKSVLVAYLEDGVCHECRA